MTTKQSFSDHVSELRLRLLVWFVFFVAGSVVGFLKSNFFLMLLTKPLEEPLFYTSPVGGFNFVIQVAILFGFLVSLPVLIYEIIKFCQPILSENVKKVVPKLVLFSFSLLIVSLLIAFYFFIPAAIHFLKGFGNGQVQALITTNEYFSFITIYLIGLGILFQMPVIILLINYIIPLSVKQLMKWQRLMIVLSFVLAAILTPTPDPVNQTMMAAPIIILYELSILLVWLVNKNRKPSEEAGERAASHLSSSSPRSPLSSSPQKGVFSSRRGSKIINLLVDSRLFGNNRKRLYRFIFFLIMVILVIFSITTYIQHNRNQDVTSRAEVINQKITEASALSDTDPNQAREILVSVASAINGMSNSDKQFSDAKERYNALISKINRVVFIGHDNAINVDSNTDKFVIVGQYLITTRSNSSDLYRQTLGEKEEAENISLPSEDLEISNLYADETNNRVLLTTTDDRIFNVSLVDNFNVVEIKSSASESWPKIKSLTTFGYNIYILEDETGNIWKYASSDGKTYQPKSSYLTDIDLSNNNAKAIVADGSIYLLFNDGKVSKFLRGVLDKFNSPELPAPNNEWQSPEAIFAGSDGDNIYIQDKNKIVEISKIGEYKRQFILPDKQITSAFVSGKVKMGWLLSGNKIYQFDLR